MITGKYPNLRLRRNRKESWTRRLVQENSLSPNDFILPIFLIDGSNKKESISTMPRVFRYTINRVSQSMNREMFSRERTNNQMRMAPMDRGTKGKVILYP